MKRAICNNEECKLAGKIQKVENNEKFCPECGFQLVIVPKSKSFTTIIILVAVILLLGSALIYSQIIKERKDEVPVDNKKEIKKPIKDTNEDKKVKPKKEIKKPVKDIKIDKKTPPKKEIEKPTADVRKSKEENDEILKLRKEIKKYRDSVSTANDKNKKIVAQRKKEISKLRKSKNARDERLLRTLEPEAIKQEKITKQIDSLLKELDNIEFYGNTQDIDAEDLKDPKSYFEKIKGEISKKRFEDDTFKDIYISKDLKSEYQN